MRQRRWARKREDTSCPRVASQQIAPGFRSRSQRSATIGWETHSTMANWSSINGRKRPPVATSKQLACLPACTSIRSAVRHPSIARPTTTIIKKRCQCRQRGKRFFTHRKRGAPPWKSDSSYATRCAMGHVKIRSELSSRSVQRVVCYEISRPECE